MNSYYLAGVEPKVWYLEFGALDLGFKVWAFGFRTKHFGVEDRSIGLGCWIQILAQFL